MSAVQETWPALLREGDLVVSAQGTGEPTVLLEQLLASTALPPIELFVGLSHTDVLTGDVPRAVSLVSFGAMGPLAGRAGEVAVLPCCFVDVPAVLRRRATGRLVVLLAVSPVDADGCHSLGVSVDYTAELLDHADLVIAEVADGVPITSAPRVDTGRLDAVVGTSRALPVVAARAAGGTQRRIAAHVATLVGDAATVQLGVGALPAVVGAELAARRDLRVCSTLAGDWLLALADAGALAEGPDAVVVSEAAGSPALHGYAASGPVRLTTVTEVNRAAASAAGLVAMNSALQVDLTGQVNAEEIDAGYVGGVGGQPDFLRAAQRSEGGCSVVMLGATADRGRRSRVVRALHDGTVTTPRSAVDVVVTEFGVADLRGRSLDERAAALIAVAAPQHRDALRTRRHQSEKGPA